MKILGIESSCDETAAAIIETDGKNSLHLLSNIVSSSMSLHAKTGGIIPEIAAREQIKYILPVIKEALGKSEILNSKLETNLNVQTSSDKNISFENSNFDIVSDLDIKQSNLQKPDIDALAVTIGPGLIGSLLVGVETVKTLSLLWNLPIIPVNHLFGHIYANFIENNEIDFPALALIVSGGHTDLVLIEAHKKITWIAGTRDDAAGEAFDKIGRLLKLPYPAGPFIEHLAKMGNPKRFSFPRPLLDEPTFDFSFSGLKTAVLREVEKIEKQQGEIDEQTVKDLAYATQDAIIDVLVKKTLRAAQEYSVKSILLGGGVAANQTLHRRFKELLTSNYQLPTTKLFVPQKAFCTDNAAMIAAAAYYNQEFVSWETISANPELYFD